MSGISYISRKPSIKKAVIKAEAAETVFTKDIKRSNLVHDVDLLMTDYNDKAFVYKSGQVDIIKKGVTKTVKFPTKKEAALYLMKAGWKYV